MSAKFAAFFAAPIAVALAIAFGLTMAAIFSYVVTKMLFNQIRVAFEHKGA